MNEKFFRSQLMISVMYMLDNRLVILRKHLLKITQNEYCHAQISYTHP